LVLSDGLQVQGIAWNLKAFFLYPGEMREISSDGAVPPHTNPRRSGLRREKVAQKGDLRI